MVEPSFRNCVSATLPVEIKSTLSGRSATTYHGPDWDEGISNAPLLLFKKTGPFEGGRRRRLCDLSNEFKI
jgi:hypothetical protein